MAKEKISFCNKVKTLWQTVQSTTKRIGKQIIDVFSTKETITIQDRITHLHKTKEEGSQGYQTTIYPYENEREREVQNDIYTKSIEILVENFGIKEIQYTEFEEQSLQDSTNTEKPHIDRKKRLSRGRTNNTSINTGSLHIKLDSKMSISIDITPQNGETMINIAQPNAEVKKINDEGNTPKLIKKLKDIIQKAQMIKKELGIPKGNKNELRIAAEKGKGKKAKRININNEM